MFSFARSSTGDAWFSVGLASSFADLGADDNAVGELRFCGAGPAQGCKVFHVPTTDSSQAVELSAGENAAAQSSDTGADLRDQVLVFQYRGKFHAVDHRCPHSSFPLSNATPFDIEDFGVVLSAGLSCPKHGWSFDLFTGTGDRGNYQLKIWETQLREPGARQAATAEVRVDGESGTVDREVWVRRKQRRG